jgi:hypothetical protein
MAQIQRFSEHVIDLAERLADVADAAEGKGNRRGGMGARWLVLPAAGAGLHALATSRPFPRQAMGVLEQAIARVPELPDDLLGRVAGHPLGHRRSEDHPPGVADVRQPQDHFRSLRLQAVR